MANRDGNHLQFAFEKGRWTLNVHFFITDGSGTPSLDGPGSKGVISIVKPTVPVQAGLYTISLGVSVNGLNMVDTYVKSLVIDNVPEIEYTGATNPAATATLAILRDDISNNVPSFGDVAPVQSAPVLAAGGTFAGGAAFKWVVAAVDANGNETRLPTMIAQEQTASPALNQKATLSWAAVSGAVSYNVYRTGSAGASGTEIVFVGNTTLLTLDDLGTAATASYQSGTAGSPRKKPNSQLTAYNFARPAFGYGALTVGFYNGVTPTNPAQGEGMRLQLELGNSDAP